jgi:hypothetical protein
MQASQMVLGIPPVALDFEITDRASVPAQPRCAPRRVILAGDEGLTADRALMIEQDAVAREPAVGFAIGTRAAPDSPSRRDWHGSACADAVSFVG